MRRGAHDTESPYQLPPLRQTEGFVAPSWHGTGSTGARSHEADLAVDLPPQRTDQPLHLVVDSTGLKVYGEGSGRCVSTAGRSGAPGANCT